ncbi:hypothetical protein Acel_1967 [Acidothermus cellulolyticus 11B]|uniref:Uncharacterized protein n=1 Tax=Acidothermus cellulolyticus (strain ATCC 43068 / DSM 8971 / 11B) TaxID=351607 RepID=A0LWC9_ACIC1|nr:hypothetical protein Acel_1967 [Acidothermus cellulolyticus 11B]
MLAGDANPDQVVEVCGQMLNSNDLCQGFKRRRTPWSDVRLVEGTAKQRTRVLAIAEYVGQLAPQCVVTFAVKRATQSFSDLVRVSRYPFDLLKRPARTTQPLIGAHDNLHMGSRSAAHSEHVATFDCLDWAG